MSLLAAPVRTILLLSGLVVAAWAVTVERMEGMDAGPGTDLGGLGWYLGIWVTMAVAMMLPSAAPLLARAAGVLPGLRLAAGYLAAWTIFGLAAFGLFRVATSFDTGWLAWDAAGPYVAGGVIVAAGIYELTPLKRHFLHRCRTPARSGFGHGVDCVCCCLGLMAALFALGVMSVVWMVVVAGVIFGEKVLPRGLRLTRAVAIALLALGLWVSFSPSSVPGLTEPGMSPSVEMQP